MTRAAVTAMLVATLGGGVAACSHGDEPEHKGTDVDISDPQQADPGVIAQSVTRVLLSWDPAKQESPFDVPAEVKKQTGGKLAQMLESPSREDVKRWKPEEWESWAIGNVQMKGFADTPTTSGDGAKRTVRMNVVQRLNYPDGTRSTWLTSEATAKVEQHGNTWIVTSLTVKKKPQQ
ncbi:hypothetical protein [Corynebacterium auriscanis]|uniref:hypothetical protein n=1 Tax=Corynebacterium auriscanis TaxID=99807 RepID=UPI003CE81ED3